MTTPTLPEYLVDPQWVQDHASDPNLVVVDIDGEAAFQRGHIPGAVMLPSNYERDPATGLVRTMPPEKFAATCQALGIGDGSRVVVYDNNLSLYAARFWWVLDRYGHTNVKVLDGGWRRWVMEGRPGSFPSYWVITATPAMLLASTVSGVVVSTKQLRRCCWQ